MVVNKLMSSALFLACFWAYDVHGGPASPQATALAKGFADPPRSARTRCYWWWLNGNVTKAAITRDLEEMQAKGFGGALIFDAGGAQQRGNDQVPAGPTFGTPAWRELFKHAVTEAHRLGLELSLSIQSGWNLGGPDVQPEECAKQLTWSEVRVTGPGLHDKPLPVPNHRGSFYRDIAVLAYPVKAAADRATVTSTISASSSQEGHPPRLAVDGDGETFWVSRGRHPGDGPSEKKPQWLQIELVEQATITGVALQGRRGYGPRSGVVQVSVDGSTFRTVTSFAAKDEEALSLRFAASRPRYVRCSFHAAYDVRSPSGPRNVQVTELALLGEAGTAIAGAVARRPIRQLRQKAAFVELGGSAPDCRPLLTDHPAAPGEEDAAVRNIVSLTDKLDREGRLTWKIPAGEWVLLRFGYTLTGAHVSTSSADWKGPVLDYMSTAILKAYWSRHVRPLLDAVGPLAGTTLRYLHTDSWECGGMNWTDDFPEQFRKRRGYDRVPYLPVIAGKIVQSRDACNRFLSDFRKSISDCVVENHYQVFADLARARGMGIHPESGGPHAGPFDALKCLGRSDLVMSEFWRPSPHRPRPPNRFFVKQAACVAHIYGKRIVCAEGFTSIGPHWNDSLWSALKPSFDHEACAGLNLTFIHTFTCSPQEMGLPGQEYFAGTHFNPNVTWWDAAGAFIAYLNRCHFMLQQGQFVADVCYYYGDHVPNLVSLKEADPARVLPGFDYDVINEEVLLRDLAVKDGRLVLPTGMSYRLLVLPDHGVLSLRVAQKVHALVQAGATVLGPKPESTMSLVGHPESEAELKRLADANRGRIRWGKTARQVLLENDIPVDFEFRDGSADASLDYIHRLVGATDVYFVANQGPRTERVRCTFRVQGKQPELWDPVTGAIRTARAFIQKDGRTTVPLEFGPYGSWLVVFRAPISPTAQGPATSNAVTWRPVLQVRGPWHVRFDPRWGGPGATTFKELISWVQRSEPGIRHYSGTATYRTTFDLPQGATPERRLVLDLGELYDVARVRLNGTDLGVVWAKPFRVELTAAVRSTGNVLEIDVINSWRNRLVGDRDLPEAKRFTRTNIRIRPEWRLLDAGLLGPVQILSAE